MAFNFEQLLVSQIPDALIVTDPDGKVVFWNAGAQSIFGFSSEEAVGHTLHALILPAAQGDQDAARFLETLKAGPSTCEAVRCKKDGTLVYVDISNKLTYCADGATEFVLSSYKDVTHIKSLRDVSNPKQIERESAADLRLRFLAGKSHELRTPLNAIIGFTGILLMRLPGPLNEDQERQLTTVQTSARQLLSLIDDTLEQEKKEPGKS